MNRLVLAVLTAMPLYSQGTEPRESAGHYPGHAKAGNASIGAEYLVRTVPGKDTSYFAGDYLVVEVAFYPPKGKPLRVRAGDFTLKINGAKHGMLPQPPGFVAAAMKYPDWTEGPRMDVSGEVGPAVVVYGPGRRGRFPGDPNDPNRLPERKPQTPDAKTKDEALDVAEAIKKHAFPEGEVDMAVSGALYFPWRGNAKKVKTVVLEYNGEAGKAAIKLK